MASTDDDAHVVIGYMCRIDWECELGSAGGGIKVYSSVEDLCENRKCVTGCGIVEVEVRIRRVVSEGDGT